MDWHGQRLIAAGAAAGSSGVVALLSLAFRDNSEPCHSATAGHRRRLLAVAYCSVLSWYVGTAWGIEIDQVAAAGARCRGTPGTRSGAAQIACEIH